MVNNESGYVFYWYSFLAIYKWDTSKIVCWNDLTHTIEISWFQFEFNYFYNHIRFHFNYDHCFEKPIIRLVPGTLLLTYYNLDTW